MSAFAEHLFDFDGEPITMEEFCALYETRDEPWSRSDVARTDVDGWFVSTVWIGIDLFPYFDPPLIFETAVGPLAGYGMEIVGRYPTAEAAREGHVLAVEGLHKALDKRKATR